MLARAVCRRVSFRGRHRWVASAVVVPFAWFVVSPYDGARDVRGDAHVWAVAASHDYHELHVITSTLPHPVPTPRSHAFGEAGTAAPGLPVFFSSFEL